MKKLDLKTKDLILESIEKIESLFPDCIVESTLNGVINKTVDFDRLKNELGDFVVGDQQERYQLSWPGKRESAAIANASISKTLRPDISKSINFESTENLYIEGDNLEALKILQESYLGRVKLIYIDPPYNTGNDFIYSDNFSEEKDLYLEKSSQLDDIGNRMVSNPETKGRFHSSWLSMIYPRLKLARNLLREDGVIFISIDGGELANLIKVCNEIFGETNNLGSFIWRKKEGGGMADDYFVTEHEYVIVFQKSDDFVWVDEEVNAEEGDFRYSDDRGRYSLVKLAKWGNTARRVDRPTMYFPLTDPDGKDNFPIAPDGSEGRWRVGKERFADLKKHKLIEFQKRDSKWIPYEKIYFNPDKSKLNKLRSILYSIGGTGVGTNELTKLFGRKDVFDNPKPTSLLTTLARFNSGENDLILDFFAGSGTTAHAILKLNAEDGLKRRFILIQVPQECDSKSEASKMGLKTISDICLERIRLAGDEITNLDGNGPNVDVGFRWFKVDRSNMIDVFRSPDSFSQDLLSEQVDNVKSDSTNIDLLFQVLIDWGVDLSLPITMETIGGREVYRVDNNSLVACFEGNGAIDEPFVEKIAALIPLRAVFRDSGFKNDAAKINVEQIFKSLSPHTEVKTI